MNKNTTCSQLKPFTASVDGFEKLFEESESKGVWAEPQLYLLPFCVPQDKKYERFRSIEVSETIQIDNEIKHRVFMVNPDPKLGLPGSFELEVMTGIYQLADEQLKETGCVQDFIELGSFRSFLTSIGRPGTGKYIAMLKEALLRLARTTCISEGFFYSKPRNLYVVESFTFITSLQIAGECDFNGGTFEQTKIKLHEFIRDNLNSNFRMLIDFDRIRKFRTDIAKSLSMHLAYRIFKNKSAQWIADYEWLANRLAIKVYDDPRSAKKQLKPALVELKNSGFIEDWQWLSSKRIQFTAGAHLIESHKQRVQARDAWITQQHELERAKNLVISQPARTGLEAARQESFDPFAAICTEYAVRGWDAIAKKATSRGITETALHAEAKKRGHSI